MDFSQYAEAIVGLIILVMQGLQQRKLKKIETNDLHELPLMIPHLSQIAETLQRIEVKMGEEFSYIKARINGFK